MPTIGSHFLSVVRQQPPLKMKKTSMADPLGGAIGSPTAATTKDEEDVDGGPPDLHGDL
jgi:hypothetical protein